MKVLYLLILNLFSSLLFAQAGSLDFSFGVDGKITTSFQPINASVSSIAIQSDGKIILEGDDRFGDHAITARYLPNGELDVLFGVEGKFIFSIPGNFDTRSSSVMVDNLDNIYLVGQTYFADSKGIVIKLTPNGKIDSTFAENGIWFSEILDSDDHFQSILLQEDGKILISGKLGLPGRTETKCAVLRLNADGTLDNDFGVDGIAHVITPGTSTSYFPEFLKLNSNEEIITGGVILEDIPRTIMVKFNQDGEVVSSFGDNGVMVSQNNSNEIADEIVVQANDKIVVVTGLEDMGQRNFGMVRYNQDGSLDTSFGVNGRMVTKFGKMNSYPRSIVLDKNQKILLSGHVQVEGRSHYAITRYDTLGILDLSFGDGGKVTTDFGNNELAFTSMIQADGKLLCAGSSRVEDLEFFLMARYVTEVETSTNDLTTELDYIKIFPNPNGGCFFFSFESKHSTSASIHLYDSSGQLVQNIENLQQIVRGKNNLKLDLNNISKSGLYYIVIKTKENEIIAKKVMIERDSN